MPTRTPRFVGALPLLLAVTTSGAAGLTWEVLYQHHSALALGIALANENTAVLLEAAEPRSRTTP
jgi:predicted Kef-type K+ transport protein